MMDIETFQGDRDKLETEIKSKVDLKGLKEILRSLDIEPDDFGYEKMDDITRETVKYLARKSRIPEFVEAFEDFNLASK